MSVWYGYAAGDVIWNAGVTVGVIGYVIVTVWYVTVDEAGFGSIADEVASCLHDNYVGSCKNQLSRVAETKVMTSQKWWGWFPERVGGWFPERVGSLRAGGFLVIGFHRPTYCVK